MESEAASSACGAQPGEAEAPLGAGDGDLPRALRTLLVNGYAVTEVKRVSKTASILCVEKRDRIGGLARSAILLADNPPANVVEMLSAIANETHSQPLVVTPAMIPFSQVVTPQKFFDLLGGEIRSDRLMRDDLPNLLDALGHNRSVEGCVGKPDDLLEEYVKEGLQFLLEAPAYRYGQDRLFESLPDGLVLARSQLNLYFDAKAYEKGFHASADDIKRFAAYVNDFNARYSRHVGRLFCFLVVSGSFSGSQNALEEKANEFYSICGTKMCHITGKDFGAVIMIVRKTANFRSALNWTKIFSRLLIAPGALEEEIERIRKDNVIPG